MEATVVLIKVSFVGPYGPKVGDVYYRLGKGVNVKQFQEGHTYSVEVGYTKSKKGEPVTYINKIVEDLGSAIGATASAPATPTSPLNPAVNQNPPVVTDNRPRRTKFGDPLSDYDLDLDGKIRRSGLVQAAVQAVASHVSKKEEIASAAIAVATELLAWVEKGNS